VADECSRCGERYPSKYYMVAGASPPVCNKCAASLDEPERDALLQKSARSVGQAVRRCLRCQTAMMRGELAYEDQSAGKVTRVRDVRWVVARRDQQFWGLLNDWVIDKAFEIDAWRCGSCGYLELATDADPAAGHENQVRARKVDDESSLL
jgi:hypothetical protein